MRRARNPTPIGERSFSKEASTSIDGRRADDPDRVPVDRPVAFANDVVGYVPVLTAHRFNFLGVGVTAQS